MTLSSLFNSLDRLDETDGEEEDFSGVYQSTEPVNNSARSRKRTLTHTAVDGDAVPKRAKIFMLEHAPSTLEPRHGGTGAPLGETTSPAPIYNTIDSEPHPTVVQIPSSTSVNIVTDLEQCPGTRSVESSPSSSPCNLRSNDSLVSSPIQSENDQKS